VLRTYIAGRWPEKIKDKKIATKSLIKRGEAALGFMIHDS
jgi:hypothetical protein